MAFNWLQPLRSLGMLIKPHSFRTFLSDNIAILSYITIMFLVSSRSWAFKLQVSAAKVAVERHLALSWLLSQRDADKVGWNWDFIFRKNSRSASLLSLSSALPPYDHFDLSMPSPKYIILLICLADLSLEPLHICSWLQFHVRFPHKVKLWVKAH